MLFLEILFILTVVADKSGLLLLLFGIVHHHVESLVKKFKTFSKCPTG